VKLTTHLHLVLRSKNAWSCISTPPIRFMAWCLVKHRDNFTFTLLSLSCNKLFLLISLLVCLGWEMSVSRNCFKAICQKNKIYSVRTTQCPQLVRKRVSQEGNTVVMLKNTTFSFSSNCIRHGYQLCAM
jgi:hypothetical protein